MAIPKVFRKEGLTPAYIDLFEINEAFSGTSVAINKVLKLDPSKVNVNGRSVASTVIAELQVHSETIISRIGNSNEG